MGANRSGCQLLRCDAMRLVRYDFVMQSRYDLMIINTSQFAAHTPLSVTSDNVTIG